MKKKFQTILVDPLGTAWGEHIIIPDDVVGFYKHNNVQRLLCSVNGLQNYHCALMPAGEGVYFIHVNKELRKKLKVESGDKVQIILQPDESKYGMYVPKEFTELIKMDPEGDKYFHQLTPGKQRSLLHIMGKPKSSETRLKKTYLIVEFLKLNKGNLDYKAMNEYFKTEGKNF